MIRDELVPIDGCWVRRVEQSEALGHVDGHRQFGAETQLRVIWNSSPPEWLPRSVLRSGFQSGWSVQDVPISATRSSLGEGRIIGRRELGGRDQVLVQLNRDGRSVWLPFENLRRIKDSRLRYVRAETGVQDHHERFRLKVLAHALENWNYLTGSLDRLDVDPLPHQIQLVHRILSSGNYNWLIADDVGLGKTIEVGLLLAALKRKGQARRILVISPAGLTRQWQDEMETKFAQSYQIYGRDFFVNKPEHWKLHDHVIASMDLVKRDDHLNTLRQAGGWDVVVFDEGHKLTRYASGERAQRYKLAEMLRPLSNAFLLLSGTPHQGYADRFVALLELVRPDLDRQLHTIVANPEVVGELILRNRKSEVTDADGNFIFKGQKVHRIPVEPSDQTNEFQEALHDYLVRGYKAGAVAGAAGRAIGFVMTTYRKLASSSVASIEHALELRLRRLTGDILDDERINFEEELSLDDLSDGGDDQDNLPAIGSGSTASEFFHFEKQMIDTLLGLASKVRQNDEKLRIFLEQIIAKAVINDNKVLIFTEYRATQSYLESALRSNFPKSGDILLINGSMKLDEKLAAIEAFNEGQNMFLISTEAGGEGLNLQNACHVMVNYDLPWNPARLLQRIGRLYRYGQQQTVVVFNLHARDSFDNAVIDLMLQRVAQIVHDMAPVGTEFNDRLYAEIVGDILEQVDLASVLQSSVNMEIEHTRAQIDDAVERARQAKLLQDEIFAHVIGFEPEALRGTLGFTMNHVNLFVRGMLPIIGAKIEEELYDGRLIQIRLPEEMRGRFAEFSQKTILRITSDRRLASRLKDAVLLDFETEFFQYLVENAKSQSFDGIYSSLCADSASAGSIAAFKLRWQNDQGEPLTEEFVAIYRSPTGLVEVNPSFFIRMLTSIMRPVQPPGSDPTQRAAYMDTLAAAAGQLLANESTRFKHPNGLVQLAAADLSNASS
ncbi:MAG: DEAD/DEAH box helicase [Mesorhizobium sp.]|uniref:DEAD/DEAH box helicase n=1 Tax=Mesorhizobium sp. TaxID=1871066 RepID=UPI000FE90433|nr:DEAD/DEAH box helicase [Mesorhizobium sp.]RWB03908.1 MAG: DEAD/DEAH box helicase [Mesorhizobium sp.]RWB09329.1 MAG: DEAD/DEAH box helicase [Mesorhizobium sp.]